MGEKRDKSNTLSRTKSPAGIKTDETKNLTEMIRTLKTKLTESSKELETLIKQNKSLTGELTTSSDNLLEEKTKNSAKPSRVGDIILGFVIGFAFTFLIIFVLWFTSLFTETISDVYKEIFCTNALK